MPLKTVELIPGVNAVQTPLQDQAVINSSQLIRYRFAGQRVLPEKLGGWAKEYPLSFGSPVRALHAWEGLNADKHLAIGCQNSLNVLTNGVATDITPRTATTNPTVNFSTTSTSKTVTIVDAGFTASLFDSIFIVTPVSIGGIVLYGTYQITSIISSTSYQIAAATAATSTVTNGGAVPVYGTTNGNFTVTVMLANHGYSIGDTFPTAVATTVGGIIISGSYLVQLVPDSSHFTINASQTATSTASASENGGNARIIYFIAISPSVAASGYGGGGYGQGGYGVGITPTPSSGTPITTTNWTLDNWGEILLACPSDGPIYQWAPDSGFANATKILNAPLIQGGMFVSNTAEILVSWASSSNGVQDPLTVNWSSAGDYTDWAPTIVNQAGGRRLPNGSRIVGGAAGPSFNIIWTDLDIWSMDYVGSEEVYGFLSLATNCGMIGRHAFAIVNSTVLWMGSNQFFALNGESVTPIPCAVWDVVFQDIDLAHTDKITAAPNNGFGEVAWYYASVSGGTGEVDSYVKVNFNNGFIWDYGKLQRTAWIDQSVVGEPIGGDALGFVYQHEISPNADGQPMMPSFTTGFFQIAEGDDLTFLDWIIPDFQWRYFGTNNAGAQISITLMYRDYPGAAINTAGPYAVQQATSYVNTRLRGRQVAFEVSSSDLDSWWRLGALRFRTASDGKR